jgi:hypothetical protein
MWVGDSFTEKFKGKNLSPLKLYIDARAARFGIAFNCSCPREINPMQLSANATPSHDFHRKTFPEYPQKLLYFLNCLW